jgi:hypothetical protein
MTASKKHRDHPYRTVFSPFISIWTHRLSFLHLQFIFSQFQEPCTSFAQWIVSVSLSHLVQCWIAQFFVACGMSFNFWLQKLLSQFQWQGSDSSYDQLLNSQTDLFSIHFSMHSCQWGFNPNMQAQNGWDISPLSSFKLREFLSFGGDLVPI